jgi:flagellar protein FliT
MSAAPQLIESYELLLQQSNRMMKIARCGDKYRMMMKKSRGLIDVERLSQADAQSGLDRHEQLRRMELLEQILELDAEIRSRLMARRDELGTLIDVSRRQRDLARAYRPASGAAVHQLPAAGDKGRV